METSCLVPVPKKISSLDSYRTVALTSHTMKILERLVPFHLRAQVCCFLGYRLQVDMEDAVIYLLEKVHFDLDYITTTVRITFFDFSSAFNTMIQPLLLRRTQVDTSIISRVTDYLSDRPQFVQLETCHV